MREVHRRQFRLGEVPIEQIWLDPKSRDDIPAGLKGLQHIWSDEALRARLFVRGPGPATPTLLVWLQRKPSLPNGAGAYPRWLSAGAAAPRSGSGPWVG